VAGYLSSLDRLEPFWWPATWTSRAVIRAASAPGEALAWWLLSLGAALAAWAWVLRAFGPRAWDFWYRGQESGLANTGVGQGQAFHSPARRPAWRVLMERDGVALWRGPGQRLQALLLASLITLFIFSLWRLPLGDDTGLRELLFLPVCALAQIILLSVGARFVFPAGSLEGPAHWLLFSAPVRPGDHLRAKVSLFLAALLPLSALLGWSVCHVFAPSRLALLVAAANFAVTPLMLACLNTGLGIAWARQDASQPEEVIGSPAGVLAMVLCTLTVLAQNALLALPLREAYYAELSHRPMAWPAIAMPVGLWLCLQSVAIGLPLRAGLRRIEGR